MPQPHITHETYKGLTPDEQAKYGEEVYGWRHHGNYEESDWHNESPAEQKDYKSFKAYKSHHSKLNIETRSVHYLKPVEAQQSEGDVIKQKADDIFGKEPCSPKVHYTVGFQDGSAWMASEKAAEIAALQQEVERLKNGINSIYAMSDGYYNELAADIITFISELLPPTK